MDWVVMAMGGWGGTTLKRWGCSLRTGCSPVVVVQVVGKNGVILAQRHLATPVCMFVDVPWGYCMCNDDGAIFGRVNVQPARQKS